MLVFANNTNAQIWQWAKNPAYLATAINQAYSIVSDASGNNYVVGYFAGTGNVLDFGSGITLTNSGNNDMYIAKYNASGVIQWARNGSCTGNDQAYSVALDGSGYIYVAGTFATANITFGGTTLTRTGTNVFIVKYDSNGNVIWATANSNTGTILATVPTYSAPPRVSVSADASGNVYVTGSFLGGITFGATVLAYNGIAAEYNMFLAKYNSSGVVQWATRAYGLASGQHCYGNGVACDASGNVFVTGYYWASCTFFTGAVAATTLTASGSYDMFLVKYDASGTVQWATEGTCTGQDQANAVAVDASGNIYVGGQFASPSITFGGTVLNYGAGGSYKLFIAKYNTSGVAQWAKTSSGTTNDNSILTIKPEASSNVYVTGFFRATTMVLGALPALPSYSSTSYNSFVAKYDASGTVQWDQCPAHNVAGSVSFPVIGIGVAVDGLGGVYNCGFFGGTGAVQSTLTFGATNLISTSTGITTFGTYIAKLNGGSVVLPIELLTYTFSCIENKVMLYWSTASEFNNDYFTIERSADAVNFEEIARIKGAGNSCVNLNYQFTDNNPIDETSYYRLKQTDYNGEFKYYNIITANCNGNLNIINTFPNPSKGNFICTISISESSEVIFIVYDIFGQKIKEQIFNIEKGTSNHKFDILMLKTGMYYIQFKTSNGLYKSQKQIIIE